jgi:multicomponent K+:H+ antiporter subunit G
MDFLSELLVASLIVIGATFALVGSFGMIKLPDLMSRLHAPTKASTLGVGGALLASMVYFFAFENSLSIHEVLISLFIFLTAPITAHFMAKAYMHTQLGNARTLPKPGKHDWGTFESPAETGESTEDESATSKRSS